MQPNAAHTTDSPPELIDADPTHTDDDVATADSSESTATPDLLRDILWAYAHLDHPHVRREEAPSSGAWSMREWARTARPRFFEQVLPKAIGARKYDDQQPEIRSPAEPMDLVAELQKMAEECESEAEQTIPEAVRDEISIAVAEWADEFGLTAPDKELVGIQRRVSNVVGRCVDAAASYPELFQRSKRVLSGAAVGEQFDA